MITIIHCCWCDYRWFMFFSYFRWRCIVAMILVLFSPIFDICTVISYMSSSLSSCIQSIKENEFFYAILQVLFLLLLQLTKYWCMLRVFNILCGYLKEVYDTLAVTDWRSDFVVVWELNFFIKISLLLFFLFHFPMNLSTFLSAFVIPLHLCANDFPIFHQCIANFSMASQPVQSLYTNSFIK